MFNFILLYAWLAGTTFLNMFFTVSGSAIINPVSAVLTDPYRAIGIGGAVLFFGSLQRVYLFRKNIFSETTNIAYVKLMLPLSVLGAFAGASLLSFFNVKVLYVVIIISSCFFIYKTIKTLLHTNKVEPRFIKSTSTVVALLTGFLQGAGLPGVDIRNNFLRANLSEVSVRAVGSFIGMFNLLIASVAIFIYGKLLTIDLILIAAVLPAIFLTQIIAKKILVSIQDRTAKIIALTMSIFGLLLIIRELVAIW